MKKHVSRAKNRFAIILLFSFFGLMAAGFGAGSQVLMYASFPLFIAGIILMFSANRCPHCGEHFRGLYWSKPNAGHCVKCGKVIGFDDCDNKD